VRGRCRYERVASEVCVRIEGKQQEDQHEG